MTEETRKPVRQCLGDGGRLEWPKGEAWAPSFGGGRNTGRVALAEHGDSQNKGAYVSDTQTGGVGDDGGWDESRGGGGVGVMITRGRQQTEGGCAWRRRLYRGQMPTAQAAPCPRLRSCSCLCLLL